MVKQREPDESLAFCCWLALTDETTLIGEFAAFLGR